MRAASATRRGPAKAQESAKKPNILVIFGDDIGMTNVSAYSEGLIGYKAPNIDRSEFYYFNDDGELVAKRFGDWKVVIMKATVNADAFLETFVAYPPSQPPASFTIDQIRKSIDERIAAEQRKTE